MITIVVGAQYGGEGKGKVTAYLSSLKKFDYICRCGGPNSSHTIVNRKSRYRFRMLPTSVSEPKSRKATILFGAGALIHIPTLFQEMSDWHVDPLQVRIDPLAGIISEDCIASQRADTRYTQIGSTLTGTGYATAQRALRKLRLARDEDALKTMLTDTRETLYRAANNGRNVLVEGHQGAQLSNYHGDYPFTSSRDSTAAAMISELGLGLKWKYDVVLVFKAFQTRNHAGTLRNELSPRDAEILGISETGGGSWGIPDKTRRVGLFDPEVLSIAVKLNTPQRLALTGSDYLFPSMRAQKSEREECPDLTRFITSVEEQVRVPISIVSTGPRTEDAYLRNAKERIEKKGSGSQNTEPDLFSDITIPS